MTTDLDRLIEAVEAESYETLPWRQVFGWDETLNADAALKGSLDAAMALLEALLPGWGWSLHDDGWAVAYPPSGRRKAFEAEIASRPARALLLATLRAYRSTSEGGHPPSESIVYEPYPRAFDHILGPDTTEGG